MELLLLADTHIPLRARDLPDEVWAHVERVDVVVHAGDWIEESFLDRVSERAARLIACWGNNDGPAVRARLPETVRATLDGVRLGVTHETGPSTGREKRMSAAYPDRDVLVFGHSHIPWDTTTQSGLRLLNPGSPTDRRRQPAPTYMTARISDGCLADVCLRPLPIPSARA